MLRSKVITILLLVTVICLGLSLLLMPQRDTIDARPESLMPFPPSGVTEVTLAAGDHGSQRLVRMGIAADRWELRLKGENGAPEIRWPVGSDRVRAFLRILERLRGMRGMWGMSSDGAGKTEAPGTAGSRLTVTAGDGAEFTLGLPRGSLGGRAVVTVESPEGPRTYSTTDELPRMLLGGGGGGGQGFLAWIDARAFAGIEGEVTRVEVVSGGGQPGGALVLEQRRGGWRIASPFDEAAEDALVDELVRGLQMLPMAEGRAARSEPPRDATAISLTAEQRQARGDGGNGTVVSRSVVHRCVTLGPVSGGGRVPVLLSAVQEAGRGTGRGTGAADSAEEQSFVFGPLTASVDAEGLRDLVRQPAFYLARRALRAEPSDVRALRVVLPSGAELRAERDGEGWVRDGELVGAEEASAIESLVELMTVGVASVAAWSQGGELRGSELLATVACEGFGGLTLETIRFGVAGLPAPAEDTRLHALLTVGNVLRYYPPEAGVGAAAAWIAGLANNADAETDSPGL
ncbi:MAG: hypothetical protein Q9O74_10080 [Planctomycetota bacterium]|nr:hypothetical protein [Planctomycetota bacterium]